MRLVLLFPGQGVQYVGMGAELAELGGEVAAPFAHASAALGEDVLAICRAGPAERLTRTLYAQPAIVAASLAALAALRAAAAEGGVPLSAVAVAGHSVGELSAVAAAGAVDLPAIMRLVVARARAMERASAGANGGMCAVLGLDAEQVEALCARARNASGETVEVANDNAPGQVVIAGTRRGLEAAADLAVELGARRVVPLQVAGAFHTSLMRGAAAEFAAALEAEELRPARVPVLLNGSGRETSAPAELKAELAAQVAAPVRWADSMRRCLEFGVDGFLELGPGQVLGGLARRIARDLPTFSVQDSSGLAATLDALGRVKAD